jgi:hypothetical protein
MFHFKLEDFEFIKCVVFPSQKIDPNPTKKSSTKLIKYHEPPRNGSLNGP